MGWQERIDCIVDYVASDDSVRDRHISGSIEPKAVGLRSCDDLLAVSVLSSDQHLFWSINFQTDEIRSPILREEHLALVFADVEYSVVSP